MSWESKLVRPKQKKLSTQFMIRPSERVLMWLRHQTEELHRGVSANKIICAVLEAEVDKYLKVDEQPERNNE